MPPSEKDFENLQETVGKIYKFMVGNGEIGVLEHLRSHDHDINNIRTDFAQELTKIGDNFEQVNMNIANSKLEMLRAIELKFGKPAGNNGGSVPAAAPDPAKPASSDDPDAIVIKPNKIAEFIKKTWTAAAIIWIAIAQIIVIIKDMLTK